MPGLLGRCVEVNARNTMLAKRAAADAAVTTATEPTERAVPAITGP